MQCEMCTSALTYAEEACVSYEVTKRPFGGVCCGCTTDCAVKLHFLFLGLTLTQPMFSQQISMLCPKQMCVGDFLGYRSTKRSSFLRPVLVCRGWVCDVSSLNTSATSRIQTST